MGRNCEICGGGIRSDNAYGVCQRTDACLREHHRRRYQAKGRAEYLSNPEPVRQSSTLRNLKKHGLTPESFQDLLVSQGGKCALFEVCGHAEPGGRGTWHIDHDHETGRVRGLLCFDCNLNRVGSNDLMSAQALIRYLDPARISAIQKAA